jgi:hypothetical protein
MRRPGVSASTAKRGPEKQGVLLGETHMAIRSTEPILAPRGAALSLVRP